MKKIYIFLLFPIFHYCQIKNEISETKEILVKDIGKINFSQKDIESISTIFKIEKKYLTSCLYTVSNKEIICYPINDKTFNYIEFEKFLSKHPLGNFNLRIYYNSKIINSKKIILIENFKME
jgi:hypothetical protein